MKKDLKSLDLPGFIVNAASEVFDTMLSMALETMESVPDEPADDYRYVGSVSFTGDIAGNIRFGLSGAFAALITAEMMGMEPGEIADPADVADVIGEVSNMIGGDLKSRLCDAGWNCTLSIPSVTMGNDFTIRTKNFDVRETCVFRHGEHVATVEINVKTTS